MKYLVSPFCILLVLMAVIHLLFPKCHILSKTNKQSYKIRFPREREDGARFEGRDERQRRSNNTHHFLTYQQEESQGIHCLVSLSQLSWYHCFHHGQESMSHPLHLHYSLCYHVPSQKVCD